jgi:N-acetylneuraminic acid mutarotase
MPRSWIARAAIILLAIWLAGCSRPPVVDQNDVKLAFIRQLVHFCADVDDQLAKIDLKAQPGMAADQLARFASQARSQPPPDLDRNEFEIMLTDFDSAVGYLRSAQTALSASDRPTADAALTQANNQLMNADVAAQKYGMPPLDSCPAHDSTTTTRPGPSPSTAPATPAGWRLRHESPVAVQQVNAAVLDGQVWVAGGLTTPTQATSTTQFYDPTIDSWGLGPPLPQAVHHAMLVTYRGQLTMIGGFQTDGNDVLAVTSAHVLFLDNNTGRWVEGPPLHHPRAAGAAAVVSDKIVVVGGRTGNPEQLVPQTEIYDGTSWHDAADIPIPGDHLAATSDPTYLYAVGGRKFTAAANTDAVQRYDPATDHWTTLPALPKPIGGAGAAIINHQLIVAGGEDTTTVSATVQALDLTTPTATWTQLPPLTQARHGLGITAIDNTLYAIDGSTRAGHTASTPTVGALTFT